MKIKRVRAVEKEIKKLENCKPCNCTLTPKSQCTGLNPKREELTFEKAHFSEPQPIACKWCGNTDVMRYGIRHGIQEYICKACGRKFTEKDSPYHMQTSSDQIGASLTMFYDGMSVADIARYLDQTFNNPVNASTVYRWVIRYTFIALTVLEPLKPYVSDEWAVDETVIKVGGSNLWFWDIIDIDTRFLLASHLSRTRTSLDASTVMRRAWQRAGKAPRFIISDQLKAYLDGIELVFGAYSKHIQAKGITHEINNNIIERFHGTIKDRTKVLRGFKNKETAEHLLDGFLVHYNFFRPHMTLKDRTPAEVAGINSPFRNWTDVVKYNKDSLAKVELHQKTPFGF